MDIFLVETNLRVFLTFENLKCLHSMYKSVNDTGILGTENGFSGPKSFGRL